MPSAMPSRFDRRRCAHCAVEPLSPGAGHEAGIVGGEKDDTIGDVIGVPIRSMGWPDRAS